MCLCVCVDACLDTVDQPLIADDMSAVEENDIQSPLVGGRDVLRKPETGMSVSEYDELPVGPGAAQSRSFEELILEQLEKEQHRAKPQQELGHDAVQHSKRSRCFLKKGDGLARFRASHQQFPPHKGTKDSRNLKQPASSETRSLRATPTADPVVQPMSRKSCLKKKTIQNEDIIPQLDFVCDNAACLKTPVTSTPDSKRPQTSTDDVELRQLAADPNSLGRDSIGDASYIARIQAQARNEEAEVKALQEFELLERYVDDNASFTSNTSTISQILARHDTKEPGKPCNIKQNGVTHVKCHSANNEAYVTDDNQGKLEEVFSDENSISSSDQDDSDANCTLVDDAAMDCFLNSGNVPVVSAPQPTTLQTIYRKIASANSKRLFTETQSVGTVRQKLLLPKEDQHSFCHLQSGFVGNTVVESVVHGTDQPSHDSVESLPRENDHMGRDAIKNTLEQDTDTLENNVAQAENLFSDEREWNDSVLSTPRHGENDLQWKTLSSNCVASTSSSEAQFSVETGYYTADAQVDSPPTSKLAQKLFPRLKPHKPKTVELGNSSQNGVLSDHAADKTDPAPAVASSALREKLAQLELEIHQFRSENAALAMLRKEREQVVNQLKKEMAEFERQKADELQRLEEFKAEEIKKLKKERKVFETYQKAARAVPDKKDRDEIELLKRQLSELQEETKRKEQKWTASNQRLRDRVVQLEQENTELREEIRVLEHRRLQEWKPRKGDPVPVGTSDTKLIESAATEQIGVPRNSQKPAEKFQKQPERQKHTSNNKTGKPEQKSKSPVTYSSNDIDIQPTTQTTLTVDVNDKTLQQRNSVPKPQTISPQGGSMNADHEDVRSTVRKTAASKISMAPNPDVGDHPYDQVQHPDGKVERVCPDGSREVLFTNGTRKQISSDGQTIIVSFFNGDIKQMLPDGRVVYYYANAQTTHTTYADGLQIFNFASGQVEKHYIDGTKEIQFPDQTIKYLFPDGTAESVFLDGTVVHIERNGNKKITFPNGQKEVHTALFKKREYPDGTTKTVFTDGRQETRYSNGRVRIKDVNGIVVLDQLT